MEIRLNDSYKRVDIGGLDIRLNLGSGEKVLQGFTGMDFIDFGQEIVWDITKGIPLPDNSVSEIMSSHMVEHIEVKDINFMIKEMIRVSKNGAVWNISCPHSEHVTAYYACHVSLWDERRWEGICQDFTAYEHGHIKVSTSRNGLEIIAKLTVSK